VNIIRYFVKNLINSISKFPLFNISVFFSLGVFVGTKYCSRTQIIGSSLFLIVIALFTRLFSLKVKYLTAVGLAMLAFMVGGIRVFYFESYESSLDSLSILNGSFVKVTGIISREIQSTSSFSQIIIDVDTIEPVETTYQVQELGAVSTPTFYMLIDVRNVGDIRYGDKIQVLGIIKEPDNFSNFSYKDYLRAQGIYFNIKAEEIHVVEYNAGNKFLIFLWNFKSSISRKIEFLLPRPHSALLSGIVFGSRNTMSDDFEDLLRRTGTTHIVAVSGYNITILIVSVGIFAPIIGRRKLGLLSILFVILLNKDSIKKIP